MTPRVLLPALAALFAGACGVATGFAADLPYSSGRSDGSYGAVVAVPAAPVWYRGGNHWRGHHSLYWRQTDLQYRFATPGWGGSWRYTPTYGGSNRPPVLMPVPNPSLNR
jgi:hypothetical protein